MALYKLSTSPMAGVGVLARTMLPQRAAIMSEKPLLECLTLGSDALVWSQMSDWIRRVGLMNAADEEALLRLDDETKSSLPPLTSRSLDRIGEDTRVLQRVRATFFQHAFPFAPPKATAPIMLRLFNHICYLNHSCDPNAVVNWHVETGEMEVRATRIIDAGEEVCVAYIDTLQGRAARWQALGFNCVCSSCNLSEERDHIVADLARSRLNEQVALLSAFKSRHFISVSDAPFVELADIPAILSDPQASDVLRHSSTVVDELCSVALCHPAILLGSVNHQDALQTTADQIVDMRCAMSCLQRCSPEATHTAKIKLSRYSNVNYKRAPMLRCFTVHSTHVADRRSSRSTNC